ncbi:DUF2304 domain-containing protein [Adlercreutzia sp. ZJ141]|uniref:DUF2304 domain-containing protein n=1 Tax=Adlercreutzia sp. ZJ141 TaxID=2709406 RepID=UPI001F149FE5|nr:DUF2304 domain-containing protein [Adlercreutzia sp. ZJ141]
MMTLTLRVVLVIAALLVLILVLRKVRNSQVRLEDSLFWLILALALLVVSIFPGIFEWMSSVAGVYDPTNFVFLFCIFVLLVKCLTMNIRISQLDTQVKELAQYLAIEKFERRRQDETTMSERGERLDRGVDSRSASDCPDE